ncbi:MAG: ribosomal RNA small subunit methyltransferase A [Candidatus Omnitrophica bacterium]|nr:ribosomal RNA small subunit methyltransferase A [Candidatus Omnitrophota bacterium]
MKSNHRPNKSLGQNFLVDARVQGRIVDSCLLKPEDTVVEIGPGQGAITSLILPRVLKLIVIEKDRLLASELKKNYYESHLEIIEGDFLKWDMSVLPEGLVVVGNIPYYISTPIIEKILQHKDKIKRAYLTVQLEFGERLAAKAGTREYGSLSCFVQYYADVKLLFKISPGSFHPQPKVHSCFMSLTLKDRPEVQAKDEEKLFALIQKSFMQRRKTIANSLKGVTEQEQLLEIFKKLNIDPQSRPEELTLLNYIAISNLLMV